MYKLIWLNLLSNLHIIMVGTLAIYIFLSCQEPKQETILFHNPIFVEYYPGPSICQVDDAFYLANA